MIPKLGDWVRFRRGGVLVIGVVQYVRRHRTTNAEWDVSTDVGEVWDSSIEEIRPAVADAATPPDSVWEGGEVMLDPQTGIRLGEEVDMLREENGRLKLLLAAGPWDAWRNAEAELERLTALLDVSERKLGEWRDRGAEVARMRAEVERLKVEYAAAIERGMRATAELQGQLAEAEGMVVQLVGREQDIRAEVARLREIQTYAEKAYEELRADLTAKVERLEHELDDAKRSRDDAIGRYVEVQAEAALSEKP